jgi:hypothetical protein
VIERFNWLPEQKLRLDACGKGISRQAAAAIRWTASDATHNHDELSHFMAAYCHFVSLAAAIKRGGIGLQGLPVRNR